METLELADDVTFGTVELTVDTKADLPEGTIAKVNFDPLMWVDKPTPDGRHFSREGFLGEDLPGFIQFKDRSASGGGHDGARLAGSLRHVEVAEDGRVTGWGYLMDNEAGRDCFLALDTKSIKGVSADLRGCALDHNATEALGVRSAYSTSTLVGATICQVPAFPDTVASLDVPELPTAIIASGTLVRDLRPPRDAFDNPRLSRTTGIRVVPLNSEFDQVFGHLATWDEIHLGVNGHVTPPRDDDYSYFYTGGNVLADDGTLVPVGRMFLGGQHADVHLGAQEALDVYAATSTAWADIRVGQDKFGIWFAGVTRPGISEELTYAGRASPVSGDWRPIKGRRRLVAVLSCNMPGFPVIEEGAADGNLALIASGPPPEMTEQFVETIEALVEAKKEEEIAAEDEVELAETPVPVSRRLAVRRGGLLNPVRIEELREIQVRSYSRGGRRVRAHRRGGIGDAIGKSIEDSIDRGKEIASNPIPFIDPIAVGKAIYSEYSDLQDLMKALGADGDQSAVSKAELMGQIGVYMAEVETFLAAAQAARVADMPDKAIKALARKANEMRRGAQALRVMSNPFSTEQRDRLNQLLDAVEGADDAVFKAADRQGVKVEKPDVADYGAKVIVGAKRAGERTISVLNPFD